MTPEFFKSGKVRFHPAAPVCRRNGWASGPRPGQQQFLGAKRAASQRIRTQGLWECTVTWNPWDLSAQGTSKWTPSVGSPCVLLSPMVKKNQLILESWVVRTHVIPRWFTRCECSWWNHDGMMFADPNSHPADDHSGVDRSISEEKGRLTSCSEGLSYGFDARNSVGWRSWTSSHWKF